MRVQAISEIFNCKNQQKPFHLSCVSLLSFYLLCNSLSVMVLGQSNMIRNCNSLDDFQFFLFLFIFSTEGEVIEYIYEPKLQPSKGFLMPIILLVSIKCKFKSSKNSCEN